MGKLSIKGQFSIAMYKTDLQDATDEILALGSNATTGALFSGGNEGIIRHPAAGFHGGFLEPQNDHFPRENIGKWWEHRKKWEKTMGTSMGNLWKQWQESDGKMMMTHQHLGVHGGYTSFRQPLIVKL